MREPYAMRKKFLFFLSRVFFLYDRSARDIPEYPQPCAAQRAAVSATPNLSNSESEICFASLRRNATYSSQLSNKLHLSDVHATPAYVGRAPASRTHAHDCAPTLRNDGTCRIAPDTAYMRFPIQPASP